MVHTQMRLHWGFGVGHDMVKESTNFKHKFLSHWRLCKISHVISPFMQFPQIALLSVSIGD